MPSRWQRLPRGEIGMLISRAGRKAPSSKEQQRDQLCESTTKHGWVAGKANECLRMDDRCESEFAFLEGALLREKWRFVVRHRILAILNR